MRIASLFLASCLGSLLGFAAPLSAQDAKPVNLDKINTEKDETDPFLTGDGLTLLYASDKNGAFDIWIAKRATATGAFANPKVHYGEKDADERSPFFFGGFLYFATNFVPDEKLKNAKNFDIYRKVDQVRASPVPQINTPEDEMHVFITPAGKEMYFSRKTKEGWKQMMTTGPNAGSIKEPKDVGFPIGYHGATLAPNGLTMFLEGPLEEGKTAIYRSKRDKVGAAWAEPTLVKSLVHPEAKRGDSAPFLASGGTRLYFASDRPEGKGGLDLWSVFVADLKD